MPRRDYRITNDKFKPDLAGELGGVKVTLRGKDRVVSMSDAQAKWFIEHGQIEPLSKPPAAAQTRPKETARAK